MKKVILIFTVASLFVACGNKEDKAQADELIVDSIPVGIEDSSSIDNRLNVFYCKENGQPIRVDKYQNGICDCPDGSDEVPGTCE